MRWAFLMLPLLSCAARAERGGAERLRWAVHYLGLPVGEAQVDITGAEGSWRATARARSAAWYRPVYDLDDQLTSVGGPGGDAVYLTRLREGGFHQDQRMTFGPRAVSVHRRQRFSDGWRDWTDTYAVEGPVHDPVAALLALRRLDLDEGARYTVPVFTGSRTAPVEVAVGAASPCETAWGPRACVPLTMTGQSADKEPQSLWVTITDDADRLPLEVVVQTPAFKVRAALSAWTP
ncbi:MAG: DUF3108 domain-containing protein [Alphaproteobacteria bacterium]|nr:DUF3108 domain-containing protein [Alphaproteobacteria bacterium]